MKPTYDKDEYFLEEDGSKNHDKRPDGSNKLNDLGAVVPDGYDETNKLPKAMLGQFKNPKIMAKVQATHKRKREEAKKQREAAEAGFSGSLMSDPIVQTTLINQLTEWALDDDCTNQKWAVQKLIEMGMFNQPVEPVKVDVEHLSEDDAKNARDYLAGKAKEANKPKPTQH